MSVNRPACPDCEANDGLTRRDFLRAAAASAAVAGSAPLWVHAAGSSAGATPETTVKELFDALSADQKKEVCFDWDHKHDKWGLLRTRISNNWHITKPQIKSDFYTAPQQALIRTIFEGIIQPDWHKRIDKQLEDDANGYGNEQNIAIFGKPGDGKFEFVMTGRHMTIRCDGNSSDHVAFGGPIFYGHAASGFNEKQGHPGNVFWPQAVAANKVFEMLDGKQRQRALVPKLPKEEAVSFAGENKLPGLAVSEMSSDQKAEVESVLKKLLEPYRQTDREEVAACLKAQGGLDKCSLSFYQDGNLAGDDLWDCWRLEGPSFVWYFRGTPHVHVWVNIADSPAVVTNS